MGDTAILFATQGAKKVVAYEPYTYQYVKAKKNIELNGLGRIIELKREAVSKEVGEIMLDTGYSDGSSALKEGAGTAVEKTRVTTLGEIIRAYRPQILKCDCEGSEYDILLSTKPEELGIFERMIVDYHHRGPESLEQHLKAAGFELQRREYGDGSGMIKAERGQK
jgi:FkbM family methyltransferase